MNKQKVFSILEREEDASILAKVYEVFMLTMIFLSVTPLMFWENYPIFDIIELFTTIVFIIDYALRWWTADLKLGLGRSSYLRYPLTFWAIVDLCTILPSFNLLGRGFRIMRFMRIFKIARLLKALRYSSQIFLFVTVLKKERRVLCSVMMFAVCYIYVTALVMFNIEPRYNPETGEETFHSFYDALYWATVTLTTVGYGDLCPATDVGRFISMMSSLFGVAIIALPSGIITASYLDELKSFKDRKPQHHTDSPSFDFPSDTKAIENDRRELEF